MQRQQHTMKWDRAQRTIVFSNWHPGDYIYVKLYFFFSLNHNFSMFDYLQRVQAYLPSIQLSNSEDKLINSRKHIIICSPKSRKQYLSWYPLRSKYYQGRKVLDKKNGLLLCFYNNQHSVDINQHTESPKLDFILGSSLNPDHVHVLSVFLMIQNETVSIRGEI